MAARAEADAGEDLAPQFIECNSCGWLHPADYFSDCRDNGNRFSFDDLDRQYGPGNWMLALYQNHYAHCDQQWTDQWSCMCNDRCPVCNAEIEPFCSDDLSYAPT